jgi:hypothetical protein
VRISAEKTYFNSDQATDALPSFVRTVECEGPVRLVWFLPNTRPRLFTPQELAEHLRVATVVERADGVMYELTSLPSVAGSSCR